MSIYYTIIVVVLLVLAIVDLTVGVANDAVNFMSSAIGSRTAKGWVILLIASLGVFFGATFSSGMMEVARSGIFNPERFVFADIMVVFAAVILADVLLLDLFNRLGLPTSTTVSVVFELLGASVVVACIVLWRDPSIDATVAQYINGGKALGIILGILLSVVIAFSFGWLMMYLSRLLFSFRYKRYLPYFGGVFGGAAVTMITYFLVIKGLKGASFITPATHEYIAHHTWTILGWSFLGWSVLLQLLNMLFKVDPSKLIVLIGTFALAVAFAGNDLVNFVGVPLAGLDSFLYFNDQSLPADQFSMEVLRQPVRTSTWILLLSGSVMVATLWLSKKSKAVIATAVNLSRQDEGSERFASYAFSRFLVRTSINISNFFSRITPAPVSDWVERRFTPYPTDVADLPESERPAFDTIRAAVSLTVASALIAIGTSLKLPLSTTYVTFMVAMGASLADRAWGRDSAVYRITGVFVVVAGWFVTALAAFTMAFLIGGFIYLTEPVGLFVVLALVAVSLFRSYRNARRVAAEEEARRPAAAADEPQRWVEQCNEEVRASLIQLSKLYFVTVNALIEEDRRTLKEVRADTIDFNMHIKDLKNSIFGMIRDINKVSEESGQFYVQLLDYMREAAHSLRFVVDPVFEHVDNNHRPVTDAQRAELTAISDKLGEFFNMALYLVVDNRHYKTKEVVTQISGIQELINQARRAQVKRIKAGEVNTRNSMLYLTVLQETKSMILHVGNMLKSLRDFVASSRQAAAQGASPVA